MYLHVFCHCLIAAVHVFPMSLLVHGTSMSGNVSNATNGVSDNLSDLTNLDNTTSRPPPPFYDITIPVNSVYTFYCNTTEFPLVWIIGNPYGISYHFVDKPNQNLTQCHAKKYVRGCVLSLIIAHQCTGIMHNCTARIEPPDAEQDGCEADYYSLRYQCAPAPTCEFPLVPYVATPLKRIPGDPCDAYYQRKSEYSDGASSF